MVKEKNFTVVKYAVKNKELIEYFTQTALLSNKLTNVNIYYQRQWFFYTQNLYYEQNTKEVFKLHKYDSKLINELKEYMIKYNAKQSFKGKKEVDFVKFGLNPYFLHYYFKEINQVDYNHSELSAQTAQQITSKVYQTFNGFKKARIDFFKNPKKYEVCPELPRYKKTNGISTFYFTNQDTKIKNNRLKFPKTKLTLPFTYAVVGKYIRMEVIHRYKEFELRIIFEHDEKPKFKETGVVAAIDPGVTNLIAITTNKGQSLLVKDKTVKSINQFANKEISRIVSAQMKTGGFEYMVMSNQLYKIYQKRHRRIEHLFYILSNHILEFCMENNVSKLALGKNKGWKQNYDRGQKSNQNFIQIPYTSLYQKITDKLTKYGIEVIEQEESYTSQASALDLDYIPVYGDDVPENSFSGKRYGENNRLYKTSDGVTINADMNGSLNILRKAFPDVEIELNDLEYMKNPKVLKNMQI